MPKIGCELEFFLLQKSLQPARIDEIEIFIVNFNHLLTKNNISLFCDITTEQGASQLEIRTDFTENLELLCSSIEKIKFLIFDLASKQNLTASFAAQPLLNDCFNSMQFNISLHNDLGFNELKNQEILHKFCQTLLDKTPEILSILVPNKEDLKRFNKALNIDLFKRGKYVAPTTLSYGIDNRTCAIRIAKAKNIDEKRVEYRVASANANCKESIASILKATRYFLQKDLVKNDERFIYGNAFSYSGAVAKPNFL